MLNSNDINNIFNAFFGDLMPNKLNVNQIDDLKAAFNKAINKESKIKATPNDFYNSPIFNTLKDLGKNLGIDIEEIMQDNNKEEKPKTTTGNRVKDFINSLNSDELDELGKLMNIDTKTKDFNETKEKALTAINKALSAIKDINIDDVDFRNKAASITRNIDRATIAMKALINLHNKSL